MAVCVLLFDGTAAVVVAAADGANGIGGGRWYVFLGNKYSILTKYVYPSKLYEIYSLKWLPIYHKKS